MSLLFLVILIIIPDQIPNSGMLSFIFVPVLLPALINLTRCSLTKYFGDLSTYIWLSHGVMLTLTKAWFWSTLGYSWLIYPVFVIYCVLIALVFKRTLRLVS